MAVTFDAVGPDATGTAQSNASTMTWSHTCSGSNRILIVGVGVGWSGDTAITLTASYNGVAMTSVLGRIHAGNGTSGYAEMFYLLAPPTGAHTVEVDISGSLPSGNNCYEGGSISFNGVSQSSPFAHSTSAFDGSVGTTPTVSITSQTDNMVVDVVACGNSVASSGQTNRWLRNVNTSTRGGNAAGSTAAGAGSVVMSYTITSDHWAIIAADLASNVAATTSNRIGIFSKDAVLAVGTFDTGIPIAYGLYDDDFVAQFSGTTVGATATGITSVPPGVFSKDATLDGAFDD